MDAYYVYADIYGNNGEKAVLKVNPIGQFQGDGCIAMAYLKKDALLSVSSIDELMEKLGKAIEFENLEGILDLEGGNSLSNVLAYTKDLEEDEDNAYWLGYFKKLEGLYERFAADVKAFASGMDDISKVIVHQFHNASGDDCDFADYAGLPFEEDEDAMREYLEENIEGDIDSIMEHFEDGEFYVDSYESDKKIIVDFTGKKASETLSISDVY